MGNELYRRQTSGIYDTERARKDIDNGYGGVTIPETDLGLMGEDLRIAPIDEILEYNHQQIKQIQMMSNEGVIHETDIDFALFEQTRYIQEYFSRLLDTLTEEQKELADSVQTWVLAELKSREEVRGVQFDHTSEESYEETIAVLDKLLIDLTAEVTKLTDHDERDEIQDGISYVQTWKKDMVAEIDVARLKRLYHLAV